jgi:hypothetical protein
MSRVYPVGDGDPDWLADRDRLQPEQAFLLRVLSK